MAVILLSLIPMIGYGIYDYLIAKPSKQISSLALMGLVVISNLIVFTLLLIFSGQTLVFNWYVLYMLGGTITGYVGLTLYSRSLITGSSGINSSIANAYPALTVCIGYFFFKEYLSFSQLGFLFCILLGIIFSSFHISEIRSFSLKKSKSSLLYALGAMIMWAGYVMFFDTSVEYFHPIVISWYVDVFGLLLIFPLLYIKKSTVFGEWKSISRENIIIIILLAVVASISSVAFGYAFSLGSLAVVSAIAACSPAVTTVLAQVFGKEKLEWSQYIAIALLIFGIAGLSYASF